MSALRYSKADGLHTAIYTATSLPENGGSEVNDDL